MSWEIRTGDALEQLKLMPDESVHCCVTSPPYWGLRDYGVSGQLGLEKTPELYVSRMTEVFREVRRVLRSDGTLWLNIGDSYSRNSASGGNGHKTESAPYRITDTITKRGEGIKTKDLCGIPWLLAFALRADGWYLRQDIIWSKPNPMPESVTDRCTKAHEYLFLLSKSARYYYDADAIAEQAIVGWNGSSFTDERDLTIRPNTGRKREKFNGESAVDCKTRGTGNYCGSNGETRNKRSVWEVTTSPFPEAHFATFPPKLIEPCILAGCPEGGTVLDPFAGAGTTGLVATRLQRNFIGIELNPAYVEMAEKRITQDAPLFNSAESYGVGTQRPGSVKQNGSPKKRISKGKSK
jgi:DNA modification methylase